MSEEFEWVSKKSQEQENKNTLPVTQQAEKKNLFWKSVFGIVSIFFLFLLSLLARLLLFVFRIQPSQIPFMTKIGRFLSKVRILDRFGILLHKIYHLLSIPRVIREQVATLVCFISILIGLGISFSLGEEEISYIGIIMIVCSIAATVWFCIYRIPFNHYSKRINDFFGG